MQKYLLRYRTSEVKYWSFVKVSHSGHAKIITHILFKYSKELAQCVVFKFFILYLGKSPTASNFKWKHGGVAWWLGREFQFPNIVQVNKYHKCKSLSSNHDLEQETHMICGNVYT